MLGCTIDVFSSIYMFFFVHFKVERANNKKILKINKLYKFKFFILNKGLSKKSLNFLFFKILFKIFSKVRIFWRKICKERAGYIRINDKFQVVDLNPIKLAV
ncbi:hypothetical protein RHABOEDO_001009 [Candidatus Rhabdochlamydia oedothoracis]|uniref:Uncharacterized protein n=2 Tax=Candidatus Rhabdochlamydia TaxID=292833 RepID=A0ABX8V0P2_9BACT|nr:hypothetical protein RHOW815_000972 [Candidatus Rhabdochlamydia sp. W815]QYF48793.1 hypothetical protein RHABOEDO_001009 [Candidatus Rhabdochlamydia oedothoracis]